MYRLTDFDVVIRISDGASIPKDTRNSDYRAYLDWLAEGNVAQPVEVNPSGPATVSAYQIRAALNQLGWRQLVENAIVNASDQDLKDAWQFSQSFVQTNPRVLQIAQSIGKTEADLKTLFELAITLTP